MKVEIDTSELTDVSELVDEIIKQAPKKVNKFLKKEARAVNNVAKKIARSRLKTRRAAKEKTSYMHGFKTGKVFESKTNKNDRGIKAYNKAPHSHLVEYGHVVKVGNKRGNKQKKSPIRAPQSGERYVKGLNIIRDAERAFEKIYERDVVEFSVKTIEEELNK